MKATGRRTAPHGPLPVLWLPNKTITPLGEGLGGRPASAALHAPLPLLKAQSKALYHRLP